jgi:hypothetical protein
MSLISRNPVNPVFLGYGPTSRMDGFLGKRVRKICSIYPDKQTTLRCRHSHQGEDGMRVLDITSYLMRSALEFLSREDPGKTTGYWRFIWMSDCKKSEPSEETG